MNAGMVIRDADLGGPSTVDIRVDRGVVTEIGRALDADSYDIVEADGGAVVPGLTDHHLHLHACAAAASSTACGPPSVRSVDDLGRALANAKPDAAGWIRGVGYIETVAGDLDRHVLDRVHPHNPVRIQHRSGALWMLNSAASDAIGLSESNHHGVERSADGIPTGRLWRSDTWMRTRLPRLAPPDLTALGRLLSGYGITSVTDATPDLTAESLEALRDATTAGSIEQKVTVLGAPLGYQPPDGPCTRLLTGPYKIVIADSDLPDLESLSAAIDRAHRARRAVAVHCVSVPSIVLLIAAFEDVGSVRGDRIEHAAVVPEECISRLAHLGVRVVTQPGFIADRGDDYVRDVDERDVPGLYRCRSLLAASIPLALSSDAPYGPLDPWAVISAAVHRRTPTGAVVGEAERLDARAALDAYLSGSGDPGGPPRRVAVGVPADLVVLSVPLADVLADPRAELVRHTYIDGVRV